MGLKKEYPKVGLKEFFEARTRFYALARARADEWGNRRDDTSFEGRVNAEMFMELFARLSAVEELVGLAEAPEHELTREEQIAHVRQAADGAV